MRFADLGVLLGFVVVSSASAQEVLHCGQWIDVEKGQLRGEVTIVVADGRFESVRNGYHAAKGTEPVDLTQSTCLPGLMDMHTHLSGEFSRTSYLDRFTLDTADVAYGALVYARKTLQAGFTTVRDLGEFAPITTALRNATANGVVAGPRIFTAGKSIATTGGHADPTNSYRADLAGDPGPQEGVVNGTADAMKAVRQRYKDGANLIKITATGGVLSPAKNSHNPQFTEAEMTAIVSTARDYDLKVAAHAHGAEGMKRAIRAGVASIEHGTLMDDEVIELMVRNGTYLVPTLMAGAWVADKSKIDGFFPAIVRPKAARLGPLMQETFARALRGGVPIAFGTDSGVSPHGDNADEFRLMVEAGMEPMAAIQSATVAAADLLGQTEDLGSITEGKRADVIAVAGNPLEDITLLMNVHFVMKDGRIYKTQDEG